MAVDLPEDLLLRLVSFLEPDGVERLGLCTAFLHQNVWSHVTVFDCTQMESLYVLSSMLNRLTRLKMFKVAFVSTELIAPAINTMMRNASTIETLHIQETWSVWRNRGGVDPAAAPPKWDQLCRSIVETLPTMTKVKVLRLFIEDIDMEECSDAPELIRRFFSLFPSLEYLFAPYLSDQNLKNIEELCPQLHSLSLRLEKHDVGYGVSNELDGPILGQVPKLRERLRFLNIDSRNPFLSSGNHLVMSKKFDSWEQAIVSKAPPNVGINLFCGRQLVLTAWGRMVFPAAILSKYIEHGLDLTRRCEELMCPMSRFWQLMFDAGRLSEDETMQNLRTVLDAMGSNVLLFHPGQWNEPFAHFIFREDRLPLLRRFLADFIAPMNSTERFYALAPLVPLTAARKITPKALAYLADPNGIRELASDLNLEPGTQEYQHFEKYIVGSLCSSVVIQSLKAFGGPLADKFLNSYADAIIANEELLLTRDCENYSLLHAAAAAGRMDLIGRILESPKARAKLLNDVTTLAWTPLHSALHAKHFTVAKALLDAGADATFIDDYDERYGILMTAISIAYCLDEYTDRYLDMWPDDFFDVISRIFAANPREKQIQALVRICDEYYYSRPIDKVDGFLKDVDSVVFPHVDQDQMLEVDRLLLVEWHGKSSLMSCAASGCYNRLKILLTCGLDSPSGREALQQRLEMKDERNNNYTALHYAATAKEHSLETIKLLVEAGATVDALDTKGNTPLQLCPTDSDHETL